MSQLPVLEEPVVAPVEALPVVEPPVEEPVGVPDVRLDEELALTQ